jgi:hypothetical protein
VVNGINSICPTIRSGYPRHIGIIYSTSSHQTSTQWCSTPWHANSRKYSGNCDQGCLWWWSFPGQGVPHCCAVSAHSECLSMRTTWVVRWCQEECAMLYKQLCWALILGVSSDWKWIGHECLTWLGWSGVVMVGRKFRQGKLLPLKPPAYNSTWDWQGKGETPSRMYFRGQNIWSVLPAHMKAHITCSGSCGHHPSCSSVKWFWWVKGCIEPIQSNTQT